MFNKESKEEKDARKTAELMQKYGLDYISEKDKESIRKILSNLVGTGMMKTGVSLSLGKPEENAESGSGRLLSETEFRRQLQQRLLPLFR